jgi:hypothetical protein
MAKLNTGTRIYGTANVDTSIGIGGAIVANLTGIYISGTINATSHTVGTSWVANTTGVYLSQPLSANGGFGNAGQVLTSNGSTGSPYWANTAAGGGSGGFANGQSIAVANIIVNGYFTSTNTAASGNSSSGAMIIAGGLGVNGNIYTAGRVGFSNSTNISVVYMYYNSAVGAIDTVFG